MREKITKIKTYLAKFSFPEWTVPLVLLGLCVASYALFIPWLKYYWDDNGMIWIFKTYGTEGLMTYDLTKRPLRGLFYTWLFPIMGTKPMGWHLLMLAGRWLVSVLYWVLIKNIWPERRKLAVYAALAFAIYPGFDQQGVSVIYSVFMIVLAIFLLSLYLNILALRSKKKWFYSLMIGSFILSVLNISTLEYFYTLELLRPLIVFWVFQKDTNNKRKNIKRAILHTAPFLFFLLLITIYRAFFFDAQTESYSLTLIFSLKENFFPTIGTLLLSVVTDIWNAAIKAWWKPIGYGFVNNFPRIVLFRYALLATLGAVSAALFLRFYQWKPKKSVEKQENFQIFSFILLAIFLGGIPFWITSLHVDVNFPNSRFTLSYMIGVCLLFGFMIEQFSRARTVATVLISLLIGLSVGMHFLIGYELRVEGEIHESVMRQLSIRVPALEPNTILMSNYPLGNFNSDNSLIGPLNYLYEQSPGDDILEYIWVYPDARFEKDFSNLQANQPYDYNFRVAEFHGSTSQAVVIYQQPDACVRILDADIDPNDWVLEEYMQEAAKLSNWEQIRFDGMPNPLPEEIYTNSNIDDWCVIYQQAGVFFQQRQWQQTLNLFTEATEQGLQPKHPAEMILFIRSYANLSDWENALAMTTQVHEKDPWYDYMLCNVWEYFRMTDTYGPEKNDYISTAMNDLLNCGN